MARREVRAAHDTAKKSGGSQDWPVNVVNEGIEEHCLWVLPMPEGSKAIVEQGRLG